MGTVLYFSDLHGPQVKNLCHIGFKVQVKQLFMKTNKVLYTAVSLVYGVIPYQRPPIMNPCRLDQ